VVVVVGAIDSTFRRPTRADVEEREEILIRKEE
jgi:hypothetical protein